MPTMFPAIIYGAKSTEDKHGSIADQIARCREAIAYAGGRDIVAELSDEAHSAYSGSRGPALVEARALAERVLAEHGACEIWVLHTDRLARGDGRDSMHLIEYVLWAIKTGVTLRSVEDDDACSDLLYAAVNGQRNHEDSKRKSAAVTAGKQRQLQRGRAFGRLCDGYRLVARSDGEGKDRIIDQARAPIVRRAFDLIEAGYTPGEVSRTLNTEGHRTARGNVWRARTVRDMVANPFYAGFAFRRGADGKPTELVDGAHEPLIDRDRWERICQLLKRMNPEAVAHRRRAQRGIDSYVLRGIGRCANCGCPLYATPRTSGGKVQRGYRCRDARQATGVCHARWIPAELAERYVLQHLDRFIEDIPSWLSERLAERSRERDELQAAVDRVQRQAEGVERERERIAEQWRRWTAKGDEGKADLILRELERADERVEQARRDVVLATARLQEWTEPASLDAALDLYSDLVALVRGELANCGATDELRAALRRVIRSAYMMRSADDTLRVLITLDGRWHVGSGYLDRQEAGWLPSGETPEWLSVLHQRPETFVSGAECNIELPPLVARISGLATGHAHTIERKS